MKLLTLSTTFQDNSLSKTQVHKSYGNTYQYYPVVSEKEFRKGTLKNVIGKYFNNSYLGVVSSLVKEEEISLDELKKLIEEVELSHKK